MTSVGSN